MATPNVGTQDLNYELVTTPESFTHAAQALAGGRGPFAIDTERASAYRYDDRAFLVQIYRRGAGTFLFAPEGLRAELEDSLAPVVGGQQWIVHAAGEDLPSLGWLGLYPGSLFDTELAGRLAGFERPNLAAMVEEFCGVTLEKGHGREDWSTTPLPDDWLDYAALDVIYLPSLAESQAEMLDAQGKLGWLEQECEAIVEKHADDREPPTRHWRDTKGLGKLRSPKALNTARALWTKREEQARDTDTAPGALLSNKALVELAYSAPRSRRDALRTRGVRRAFDPWPAIVEAREASPATYPAVTQTYGFVPGKSLWQREYPESYEVLQQIREDIAERADELSVPTADLLAPALLREMVWKTTTVSGAWTTHRVATALSRAGARPWQVEQTAPIIAGHVGAGPERGN
ncbi:HRDC domain-containing protein [Corynebacterium pilosum]|uniref:Ribonuclease D protein n=1 Tax=Corynebacterium pilosum TaxID=35756 RepID=A0A376CQ63_9CORY|nr:HRDC domain-containing protein [Corynebacterium pilosum]STC70594.1 ribonuclease D protein [Corynebacterium pilosum]